jgi:hypothetical protein
MICPTDITPPHACIAHARCTQSSHPTVTFSWLRSTTFQDFSISRLSAAMVAWSSSESFSAVATCRSSAVACVVGGGAESGRGVKREQSMRVNFSLTLAAFETISELSSRHFLTSRFSLSVGWEVGG